MKLRSPSRPTSRLSVAPPRRIREHARIIIDSGSTTAAMIPELGHKPGLVVMTNSLNVVNALRELEHEPVLLMTGDLGSAFRVVPGAGCRAGAAFL